MTTKILSKQCYHCGSKVADKHFHLGEKVFCCNGCKSVYQILNKHELCKYYDLHDVAPGITKLSTIRKGTYAILEDTSVAKKFVHFTHLNTSHLTFYLPQIHCSSCLWLLENLQKLNLGIKSSRVNFDKKEVFISFNNTLTTTRAIAETLDSIGYGPHLTLHDVSNTNITTDNRLYWYKIGVAGFCFSNIMMLSIPEYLAFNDIVQSNIKIWLQGLSILLSLPVIFYSASAFFVSAWAGLKNKIINIDFPIAAALVITFGRSLYEILSGYGSGYLDSMSGIVFFMLIGRWLQEKTNQTITFDRDYSSFLPIAVHVLANGKFTPKEVSNIVVDDIIKIHNSEIIPVDAIISKGRALIDYSFVNGETIPTELPIGSIVYAGGKQLGGSLELLVVKEVSKTYLTNLWNNAIFNKKERPISSNIYDIIGQYFTIIVVIIGLSAGTFWWITGNNTLMWNALTTVLIVACPCALLLAKNYTQGHIMKIFSNNKFYIKSANVIDKLSQIQQVVFDKTGTITETNNASVTYEGNKLTPKQLDDIGSLLYQSAHPLSKLILTNISATINPNIHHFKEITGQGIEGWIDEQHIKIGKMSYISNQTKSSFSHENTVSVSIDGNFIGSYMVKSKFRKGIKNLLNDLSKSMKISLLSGDNDAEREQITKLLGADAEAIFYQSPQDKLDYIENIQSSENIKVMMIGDGLNDAGALRQSDVGIALMEHSNSFTPASDAVLDASHLVDIHKFLDLAIYSHKIITLTFVLSIIYNVIGLYFAVQGILSPVIAAILMPASSISIIFITYGCVYYKATALGLIHHLNTHHQ